MASKESNLKVLTLQFEHQVVDDYRRHQVLKNQNSGSEFIRIRDPFVPGCQVLSLPLGRFKMGPKFHTPIWLKFKGEKVKLNTDSGQDLILEWAGQQSSLVFCVKTFWGAIKWNVVGADRENYGALTKRLIPKRAVIIDENDRVACEADAGITEPIKSVTLHPPYPGSDRESTYLIFVTAVMSFYGW